MEDTENGTVDSRFTSVGGLQPEKKTETPQLPDFPEGGLWGWLTLVGAALIQYSTFGYTNAFGVYQDYYIREYLTNYSPSEIGWIGGTQIFFVFSSGIFTGRAFDRGYFHHLIVVAALLHALGLFTLSITYKGQYYQVFLAQGVCLGLANGLPYIPSISVVSHYFQRQRPLAMGIVSAGAALGAVLHPIMLNKLFNGPIGFHNGIRISAALNTFLFIVAIMIMRTRLPPKTTGPALPIKEFFTDAPYVFLVLAGVTWFLGLFYPIFNLQTNAILHGVDANFAFYSLPILNAAGIFGRIIPPMFAPRFGVLNVFILSLLASGVTVCTMSLVHDVAGTAVFGIVYGFCSGAAIGLTAPVMASICKDISEIGVRLGIVFAVCGIVGLFATPISGAVLTDKFHWRAASVLAGVMIMAASFMVLASRWFIVRRKGTQFV